MSKKCIIDFRMRKIEKDFIKSMGYELIQTTYDFDMYDEIASHVDIYYVKVGETVFCSPNRYIENMGFVKGTNLLGSKYPEDVKYNLCIMGKKAIHNFKYTDDIVKAYVVKSGYELIDVMQGYTKCSVSVLSNNACITSDIEIAKKLLEHEVDCTYVKETEIKLLKRTNHLFNAQEKLNFEYSNMAGFIGGALVKLGDTVILFGDKANLLNGRKIEQKILSLGLKFKDFKGFEIVDYGGIVEVNV